MRNKTKDEAIKFQEKQYLRNNQSYLSVKNTPILNNYRLEFQNHNLKVFFKNEEIISISEFNFENLQFITKEIKNEKLI